MLEKIKLLLELQRYQEGREGNTDLAGRVVWEFNGNSKVNQMKAWAETPHGKRYLAGERILDNIESFRDRDSNTLGTKYLQWIDKYNFGVVHDELPTIKDKYDNPLVKAYGTYLADMHDITHIITGYPPDTFGELMRIRIMKQFEGRGWGILWWNGWLKAQFLSSQERKYFNLATQEAKETAKTAKNYIFEDCFEMLGWHINKVRKNLSTKSNTLWNWEKDLNV